MQVRPRRHDRRSVELWLFIIEHLFLLHGWHHGNWRSKCVIALELWLLPWFKRISDSHHLLRDVLWIPLEGWLELSNTWTQCWDASTQLLAWHVILLLLNLHVGEGCVRHRARLCNGIKSFCRRAMWVSECVWSDFIHLVAVMDKMILQMFVYIANWNYVEHFVTLDNRVDPILTVISISKRFSHRQ